MQWDNKNKIILIFTLMNFKKKIKKNTCRYHYQNLDDMIYGSWDIEQNILKLVTLGYFLPFYPHKNPPKSKFWKIEKFARDIIILHVYQKSQSIMYSSWDMYWERQKNFVILVNFLPFCQPPSSPNDPKNQNFEKKMKKFLDIWIYFPFIHTCVP